MTASRMLPAMDIHHPNQDHDSQYYVSKKRFPDDDCNDQFELFICPYDINHKVTVKRWNSHLITCRKNHGSSNYERCPFNAAHHVPRPEWEWHKRSCPDRDVIRQDIEGASSSWKIATHVNHNPNWIQPASEETWEDEIDEEPEEFVLDPQKGMPLSLLPQQPVEQEEFYPEDDYYDNDVDGEEQIASSVLQEELIPEKPANWNDLSKTQKKNHRRKYERQQQRMKDGGITEDHYKPETDPSKWTEKEREAKLNAIKAAYPLAPEKMSAIRVDFTSLLNIVCQKTRLNIPKYSECPPGARGGFAFKCQVFDKFYEGRSYSSTKRDAKHDSAKWALLCMEIPGLDGTEQHKRQKPIYPKTREEATQLREADEAGRLMHAGYGQTKQTVQLRQPRVQQRPVETSQPLQPQMRQNQPTPPQQPSQQKITEQKTTWGQIPSPYTEQNSISRPPGFTQPASTVSRPPGFTQPANTVSIPPGFTQATSNVSRPPGLMQPANNVSRPPGFTDVMMGVGNMKVKDKEFPSLGSSSDWSTVNKKGKTVAGSAPTKRRGRGRATAMKL